MQTPTKAVLPSTYNTDRAGIPRSGPLLPSDIDTHTLDMEEMDWFEDDASPPDNGTPFDSGIGRIQCPSSKSQATARLGLMQSTSTVVQDFPISFLTHFSSPPRAMIS